MTREEAIYKLRGYSYGTTDEAKETFDMAIKALEQEPCEDCISREQAIATFRDIEDNEHACWSYKGIYDTLMELPSVQPVNDVLNKIRAELLEISEYDYIPTRNAMEIIDKYREGEE